MLILEAVLPHRTLKRRDLVVGPRRWRVGLRRRLGLPFLVSRRLGGGLPLLRGGRLGRGGSLPGGGYFAFALPPVEVCAYLDIVHARYLLRLNERVDLVLARARSSHLLQLTAPIVSAPVRADVPELAWLLGTDVVVRVGVSEVSEERLAGSCVIFLAMQMHGAHAHLGYRWNGRKCQQRARSRERVRARKRCCFLEHGCREEGADGTRGEPCLHRPYAVLRIHDTQITITREPRRVRHRARPNPRHLVGAKLVVT